MQETVVHFAKHAKVKVVMSVHNVRAVLLYPVRIGVDVAQFPDIMDLNNNAHNALAADKFLALLVLEQVWIRAEIAKQTDKSNVITARD